MPETTIETATVMYRKEAVIGSRVKHYGERFTGCATATIVGFEEQDYSYRGVPWIKVLVKQDRPSLYGDRWDWDRTEIAPELNDLLAPAQPSKQSEGL